jgi:hypothetical protein
VIKLKENFDLHKTLGEIMPLLFAVEASQEVKFLRKRTFTERFLL